jgi:predicted lysophospholipase L1 biosynthesis ABC-type transport system permease subunit
MNDGPEWFAPKRYGYGSGLPIAWQGWAVLIGYVAIVVALVLTLRRSGPVPFLAAVIPVTVVFAVICARTTRGGWRWRWGKEE